MPSDHKRKTTEGAWPNQHERGLIERAMTQRRIAIPYADFAKMVQGQLPESESGSYFVAELNAAINLADAELLSANEGKDNGSRPHPDRFYRSDNLLKLFVVSAAVVAVVAVVALSMATSPLTGIQLGLCILACAAIYTGETLRENLQSEKEGLFMERLREEEGVLRVIEEPLRALLIKRLISPESGQSHWSVLEARRFYYLARDKGYDQSSLGTLEAEFDARVAPSGGDDSFSQLRRGVYYFFALSLAVVAAFTLPLPSAGMAVILGATVPLMPVLAPAAAIMGVYVLSGVCASLLYDSYQDKQVVDSVVSTSTAPVRPSVRHMDTPRPPTASRTNDHGRGRGLAPAPVTGGGQSAIQVL